MSDPFSIPTLWQKTCHATQPQDWFPTSVISAGSDVLREEKCGNLQYAFGSILYQLGQIAYPVTFWVANIHCHPLLLASGLQCHSAVLKSAKCSQSRKNIMHNMTKSMQGINAMASRCSVKFDRGHYCKSCNPYKDSLSINVQCVDTNLLRGISLTSPISLIRA